mgnify:CR=1 FL=1
MFETIVNYTTKNDGYKYNGKLNVKGLMLHSTATPGIDAKTFRNRFNKPKLGKSVHGFLDDKFYIQCLPYDKKAGHCRYDGNNTHIGIELCEPKEWKTDEEYFGKVYANAVELFAQLCNRFGLTEQNIVDHSEGYKMGIASNHSDVGHWFPLFGKNMDMFRADVRERLAQIQHKVYTKKEVIKELQRALNKDYNETLAIDGIIGKNTRAAVKRHLLRYRKGKALASGAYVKWVQQNLLNFGYHVGNSGTDGKYGRNTADGVKKFQANQGIRADGIVGMDTVYKIVG